MAARILVNRHDFDEFVFVDGQDFWADGKRYDSILKCHDLEGLNYGVPPEEVFEELPRRDFDGVLRALRAVEDDNGAARSVIEEVDRFCTTLQHWKWKASERGESLELVLKGVNGEDETQATTAMQLGI